MVIFKHVAKVYNYKTTMDAWNGYHSVRLAEEDWHLTTFWTPWGRYRYKNMPQGFLAAGESPEVTLILQDCDFGGYYVTYVNILKMEVIYVIYFF